MNAWTNPSAHSGIPSKAEHWGIVGGGMLGMTLAHRLAQQGKRVTLFEAASHLGGLASTWSLGGIVWDRHYHVISLSDRRLLTLLDELGLERDLKMGRNTNRFLPRRETLFDVQHLGVSSVSSSRSVEQAAFGSHHLLRFQSKGMEKIGTDSGDCLAAKMVRKTDARENLAAAFAG